MVLNSDNVDVAPFKIRVSGGVQGLIDIGIDAAELDDVKEC
ncbi:hypothetical protein CGMCC3_g8748 [Colletotrichum fructicola]|nr:uncharacterized protein CGMCC3_g8748 [Colletotrichum fructicola]KAE9575366.1 hypothetical protein CGMCC3_g8748 [Colletotrichum fructicola]